MRLLQIFSFIILVFCLQSCSTSNEVASNNPIQKRKYRSGYHLNWKKNDHGYVSKRGADSNLKAEEIKPLNANEEVMTHDALKPQARLKIVDKDRMKHFELQAMLNRIDQRVDRFEQVIRKEKKPSATEEELKSVSQPSDGIEAEKKESSRGTLSLVFGILAWVFAILGLIVPFIGLLSLPLAIAAIVLGAKHRKQDQSAKWGFWLGLIFLIVSALLFLLFAAILILVILAFAGAI